MDTLRIATRKSPLALWQSEHVAARLRAAHPGLEVVLVPMSTRGDEQLDRSLAAIGGKGLFLKELEPEFVLPAILTRADPADAFVSNHYDSLDALPPGAVVGTSSLRRQAQLRARRPDLLLRDLRGNVNTRLARLDAGEYDAIVLACAGLQRLGLDARVRARLAPPDWLPAPAQAVVAVETRSGDAHAAALVGVLEHAPTRTRIEAERALNRALHGSCHVPVAAYAELDGERVRLSAWVGSAADGSGVRAEGEGMADAPQALGRAVAADLLAQGAGRFLG